MPPRPLSPLSRLSLRQPFRVPPWLLLCALGCLAAIPGRAAGNAQVEPRPVKNWIGWDLQIERGYLADVYRRAFWRLGDPVSMYEKAVTYDAPLDSLGLAAFRRLSPGERSRRRDLAAAYLNKAQRFEVIIWDLVQYTREKMVLFYPKGFMDSLARALGNLVNAVGLDPANPEAWYDLSYLAGTSGDAVRQDQALRAALAAIGSDSQGVYRLLKQRLCLDLAWLARERGLPEEGLEWLDRAESREGPNEESYLLRGLLLADQGRFEEACHLAEEVRSVKIYKPFWGTIPSDFAQSWIQAMAYRAIGELPLARFALGRIDADEKIPYAHRFYNDVGLVCEESEQGKQAQEYYAMATVARPYFTYFPVESYEGPGPVLAGSETSAPYSVGFQRFYVAGSRFAHAAQLALLCELAPDSARTTTLGPDALESLSICRRRGIRPAESLALRGFVHYVLGDEEQAEADLAGACEELGDAGRGDGDVCVLAGMLKMGHDAYAEALPLLDRAIRLQPGVARDWRALGVAMIETGKPSLGERVLTRAVELDPTSPAGWYNRGLLRFQHRQWGGAVADLELAVGLAPAREEAVQLLERARKALQAPGPSGDRVPAATGPPAGLPGAPPPLPEMPAGLEPDLVGRLTYWQETTPPGFRARELEEAGGQAALYPGRALGARSGVSDLAAAAPALSAEELDRILKSLEHRFAAEPTRSVRRELALAYVRSGRLQEGRDLLLPYWDGDITADEMCIVLEADRGLGDATRARRLASTLAAGPPRSRDPVLWSLVAFCCLDRGFVAEGLAALDAAIQLDPGNAALRSQRQRFQPQH